MYRKLITGFMCIILLFATASCSANKDANNKKNQETQSTNNETSDYDMLKNQISKFGGKSYEDIKERVVHNLDNGHKIYMFDDGKYSYDVYDDGSIFWIGRGSASNSKWSGYISKDKILETAKGIVSRLNVDITDYAVEEYPVSADDGNAEHYAVIDYTFLQKASDSMYTGSYISMEIDGGGQLMTLGIHREKGNVSVEQPVKITKDGAKKIIQKYMSDDISLKMYTGILSDKSKYTLNRSIFYGVPVWYFRTVFKYSSDSILPNKYAMLEIRYIIDANTGEFLKVDYPPYPEFKVSKDIIDRQNALASAHPDYN